MDKLKSFVDILSDIKSTSNKIIKASFILMKRLDDGEIVENFIDDREDAGIILTHEEALLKLQDASLTFLGDSETINYEIDNFITIKDEGFLIQDSKTCPYLSQVWNGDMYDEVEIKALEVLLKDLKDHYLLINEYELMRRASVN